MFGRHEKSEVPNGVGFLRSKKLRFGFLRNFRWQAGSGGYRGAGESKHPMPETDGREVAAELLDRQEASGQEASGREASRLPLSSPRAVTDRQVVSGVIEALSPAIEALTKTKPVTKAAVKPAASNVQFVFHVVYGDADAPCLYPGSDVVDVPPWHSTTPRALHSEDRVPARYKV